MKVNKTQANLFTLRVGQEPEHNINIFIHGYQAVKSKKGLETLCSQILRARPSGTVCVVFWKSGNWKTTALPALPVLARWAWRAVKLFRHGIKINPLFFVVDLVVTLGLKSGDYMWKKHVAEALGKKLPELIRGVPGAEKYPINLIGHSLGARVIYTALSSCKWERLRINDCVMLGGAVNAKNEGWKNCAEKIDGRFYNAYSTGDRWLQLTPDLEKSIGRHPIEQIEIAGNQKVSNTDISPTGHMEYWPKLPDLLPKIWPRFKQIPKELGDSTQNL